MLKAYATARDTKTKSFQSSGAVSVGGGGQGQSATKNEGGLCFCHPMTSGAQKAPFSTRRELFHTDN